MVIDSSAVFAIAFNEPERESFLDLITNADVRVIGAPTLFECRVVALRRMGVDWSANLDRLLNRLQLSVAPFEEAHEVIATTAFRKFGKGLDKAGLNFGDCFTYAIAKAWNEPLLFKGEDFRRTDIVAVI
ncbi:MAG TPA: type II toxin-antitoxin system VapC family toxin [Rhizomicrobium sp.]|jgi:ribonuclease VapC|nr:type II toxin-antitoxin system VapC family toxin [Rhizomicrobium sp.]